jgi:hypothetical protein
MVGYDVESYEGLDRRGFPTDLPMVGSIAEKLLKLL